MSHELNAPAEGAYLLLSPDYMITAVSDDYVAMTGVAREEIIGQNVFDAFPENPDDPASTEVMVTLRTSLERVTSTRQPDVMPIQRYDLHDGVRYWKSVNSPVFDDDGSLVAIVNYAEDMTKFAAGPAFSLRPFRDSPFESHPALALVILASLFQVAPELLSHTPVGFESRGALHHFWHYALFVGAAAWLAGLLLNSGRSHIFGLIVTFGVLAMNTVAVFAVGDAGSIEGALRVATLTAIALRLYDLERRP